MTITVYSFKKEYGDDHRYSHSCEWCDRVATYWTQNEGEDYRPLTRSFYHCDKHRFQARKSAETVFVKPDPACKACGGSGEVADWVPYGPTNVPMYSLCGCVEEQIPEYADDWDVELVTNG